MENVQESRASVNFDQELTDTRALWRQAVAEVAANARAALPDSHGRIAKAVALVLAGDVDLLPDGTARIASQADGETIYHIVNGHCDCRDYAQAPEHWCKHRLAAALAKRAYPLAKHALDHDPGAKQDVSATGHPPHPQATPVPSEHVVMIQGKPFVKYAGLLKMAHAQGLERLSAHWLHNDPDLSLAQATATFTGGRVFTEGGDASPENTNRKVALHFRRVALTRAKARALRDALGVDLVAVEELAEEGA
jgi:hypothetical protein